MVVQQTPDEVHISFFQIQPPMIVGDEEERQAQLAKIDCVEAKPISRIIVPKSKMQSIIEALQMNVKLGEGKAGENADDKGEG